jgi:hypothetical protein
VVAETVSLNDTLCGEPVEFVEFLVVAVPVDVEICFGFLN